MDMYKDIDELRTLTRTKVMDLLKRRSPFGLRNIVLAALGMAPVDVPPPKDEAPHIIQRTALMVAVGKWYDECREKGGLDDYCFMGSIEIDLQESDSWDETYEEKLIDVGVTKTCPLEQI